MSFSICSASYIRSDFSLATKYVKYFLQSTYYIRLTYLEPCHYMVHGGCVIPI